MLPQKAPEKENESAEVKDDIPKDCVVGQTRDQNTVFKDNENEVGPLSTSNDLRKEQEKDLPYQKIKESLIKNWTITAKEGELHYREEPANETIQFIVLERFGRGLNYHEQYPTLAGHRGTRKIYDVPRKTYYWLHMASDVHKLVLKWESSRHLRPPQKHKQWLQLISSSELEFVTIKILGPLTKTNFENWFIVVMTDRYRTLTQTVPVPKTTAPHLPIGAFENWIVAYDKQKTIMTDYSPQFASRFFAVLCSYMNTKPATTTGFRSQVNSHAERFKETLVGRLPHYIDKLQTDWDSYVQLLPYVCNTQVQCVTKTCTFS